MEFSLIRTNLHVQKMQQHHGFIAAMLNLFWMILYWTSPVTLFMVNVSIHSCRKREERTQRLDLQAEDHHVKRIYHKETKGAAGAGRRDNKNPGENILGEVISNDEQVKRSVTEKQV